ncbi:unnamed protein product [Calicophoron daubneyi]|uniref:EF-hand domain-containing protein n=1 Tax=Calicophoron daubneyi TaxID=300641 RepID=A0AAV2TZW7_CALDB
MDGFVDAFINIDKDGSGDVTTDELREYVKENHLDEVMITRWQELFDPRRTGKITLETFCDKLGLKQEEVRAKQRDLVSASRNRLGDDIKVIDAHMSMEDQIICSDQARRISNSTDPFDATRVTQNLKAFLDAKFGPTWQVLVVDGSYWITHTYSPEYSFHFLLNGHAYLMWKVAE